KRELDSRGRLVAPGIHRPTDKEPVSRRLPRLASIKPDALSRAELWNVCEAYKIVPAGPAFRAAQGQWLGRLWSLPQGSPRIEQELDALLDGPLSKTMVRRMARRGQEQYTTMDAVSQDPNTEFTRIPEDFDPECICDACADLAGEEGTYAYHQSIGLPGAGSCYGGDECRCKLVPTV
ncbi:MAG: hypothetical protein KAY24_19860, partial [Candidatus Eisenbacteria sp.]|nr:hypothetical protein [Candidatus Eisenbacteria bacterium]